MILEIVYRRVGESKASINNPLLNVAVGEHKGRFVQKWDIKNCLAGNVTRLNYLDILAYMPGADAMV